MGNNANSTIVSNDIELNKASGTEEVLAYFENTSILGKRVIVTGANTGLGFETARVLASHGASVLLCARSEKNGESAAASILSFHSTCDIDFAVLDLGSHASIRKFAKEYVESGKPLHILINNAGVMASPKSLTFDGLEQQMGVNHIGHFLLTQLLLPVMEKSGSEEDPARVINVSSLANFLFAPSPEGIRLDDFNADSDYNPWVRYGETKLANILFTKELNRRMSETHKPVISVALHPGIISETELNRHSSIASTLGAMKLVWSRAGGMSVIQNKFDKRTEQGAATQVMLAVCPYEYIKPGEYYADCGLHNTSIEGAMHPRATDAELATQLWEKTEEVIKNIQNKQKTEV